MKGLDLHTHLQGSTPLATINQIRQRNGQSDLVMPKNGLQGLDDFSLLFSEFADSFQRPEDFGDAMRALLLEQHRHGAVYSEVRVSLHRYFSDTKFVDEVMAAIREAIDCTEAELGVLGSVILEGTRKHGIENLRGVLAHTKRYYGGDCVVGFGIGGTESPNDLDQYSSVFAAAEEAHIPVSVHAGEIGDLENIVFAMRQKAVRRIAHALGLRQAPPALIAELTDQQKLIEVCLTSNRALGYVGEDHPAKEWHKLGFPLSFATDDTAIFRTTFQRELQTAQTLLGLDEKALLQMQQAALGHTFCSPTKRESIQKLLVV